MKRDMDLVRELLLKIADASDPPNFSAIVPDRKEGTPEFALAAYHMKMLSMKYTLCAVSMFAQETETSGLNFT